MSFGNVEKYQIRFSWLVLTVVVFSAKMKRFGVPTVAAVNDNEDLVFSEEEKDLLEKVKQHPDFSNLLTDDYMNTDFYLVRFLRDANLNVEDALDMIYETMTWRRENNVSQILNEDWSDMRSEFPIDLSSRDLMNRPVLQVVAKQWNVRQGVYYGNYDRFERYSIYIFERLTSEIFKIRREGHTNVTRGLCLLDASGGDLSTHGCLYCITFATDWLFTARTHYRKTLDELFVTNLSPLIAASKNILTPFFSTEMQKGMRTFSSSSNVEVMIRLDERIPRDRRIFQFGGTKAFENLVGVVLTESARNKSEGVVNVRERLASVSKGVMIEYALISGFVLVVISICICCVRCLTSSCGFKYDKVAER